MHELAHEMIHKAQRRIVITKTVEETEAESVASVGSKAIGLENGRASADYIQLYHDNAMLLQESLEVVQRTAARHSSGHYALRHNSCPRLRESQQIDLPSPGLHLTAFF